MPGPGGLRSIGTASSTHPWARKYLVDYAHAHKSGAEFPSLHFHPPASRPAQTFLCVAPLDWPDSAASQATARIWQLPLFPPSHARARRDRPADFSARARQTLRVGGRIKMGSHHATRSCMSESRGLTAKSTVLAKFLRAFLPPAPARRSPALAIPVPKDQALPAGQLARNGVWPGLAGASFAAAK